LAECLICFYFDIFLIPFFLSLYVALSVITLQPCDAQCRFGKGMRFLIFDFIFFPLEKKRKKVALGSTADCGVEGYSYNRPRKKGM
jgi:hypothetical protein